MTKKPYSDKALSSLEAFCYEALLNGERIPEIAMQLKFKEPTVCFIVRNMLAKLRVIKPKCLAQFEPLLENV